MEQKLYIYGTGLDPENFVVVMDFWLEGAKPWNRICPRESKHQKMPAAGNCAAVLHNTLCFSAADLFSPGTILNQVSPAMAGQVQGPGCKHDGGPLWISIPLEDDPVVAKVGGGAPYARTVWMRVFQRASKHEKAKANPSIDHNRGEHYAYASRTDSVGRDALMAYHPRTHAHGHSHGYAQVESVVEDDLVECIAIQLCTTTGV